MEYPVQLTENGVYVVENLDFGEGRFLTVHFDGFGGCARADLALDTPENVFRSLSLIAVHGFPEKNLAHTELPDLAGTHTLYLKPRSRFQILSVEQTQTSPVEPYEPVPEEAILPSGSEYWAAEDELGRHVKNAEDVRGARKDRRVGIFYWSWRDGQADREPVNVSKIMDEFPGAEYNENHPAWGPHHSFMSSWNEPLFGYYLNRDPYVIRRHAVLLADAGVDMVMFDCTNGTLVWKESYEPILEGFRAARADGINAPKVAFMLNFGPLKSSEEMLRALYADLYQPGRYRDLWFMLDGKPMIMAYPECLPKEGVCPEDTALLEEIRNFFTFRPGQPSYGYGPTESRMWGWLEKYPQHKFGERADGTCEMVTVGVAQNCNDELLCTYFNNKGSYGRSYTHQFGHGLLNETSYKYGYNVQEQWDRAIDCDPEFIFITGWNEWIMGRWHEPWVQDPNSTQLAFVDQFDKEHSRDIEPDRDGIRDNYYLQMCSNIRRYKGAAPRKLPSAPKTIASLADFDGVTPVYRSEKGTTIHRDCRGFGSTHYINDTGRNNIVAAKVARDDEFVWFLAECAEEITPKDADFHMTLYLNRDGKTGWEGFDLAVSRRKPEDGKVLLEEYTVTGYVPREEIAWQAEGKRICYRIPRKWFGEGTLDFTFKWADNVGEDDAMDFYCDGDTAPTGRFSYVYREAGFPKKQ